MKQLTNTEIQILSLMLPHALHAVDNNPYYFSDTWFKRKQVTDLISKLDKMDDAIRKSKETYICIKDNSVIQHLQVC